jgi:hypothetical protein
MITGRKTRQDSILIIYLTIDNVVKIDVGISRGIVHIEVFNTSKLYHSVANKSFFAMFSPVIVD